MPSPNLELTANPEQMDNADNQEEQLAIQPARKAVMFIDSEKNYADFLVRLKYDDLTASHFLRSLIKAYLEKNNHIMAYLDEMKDEIVRQRPERRVRYSKTRRNVVKKIEEKEKKLLNDFGLGKEEIDNIFDVLEKDFPDL